MTFLLGLTLLFGVAAQSAATAIWLDEPLVNWNVSSSTVPHATPGDESLTAMAERCRLAILRETPVERAVAGAGWMPFLVFDREIREHDIEIIGGMAEADGMCRPQRFNVFVFVGGRFAGTLSPASMTSRTDGVVGAVRLAPDGRMAAEFSRYTNADALCCPSSRVTVQYRIVRNATPVVEPVGMKTTR